MVTAAASSSQQHHGDDGAVQPWPRDVARTPYMSIGKLVEKVKAEFPALSLSKVRYLEQQGLITPWRDKSGYRKYSDADLERLRYCLIQQRDHYLPITKILENLAILDAGEDEVPIAPVARVVASQGKLVAPVDTPVTVREIEDLTGVSRDFLCELVDSGIIKADLSGRFAARSVSVVTLMSSLAKVGLEPRHIGFIRLSAERQADLVDQSVGGQARVHGVDKERRVARAEDIRELVAALNAELLRIALDNLQ
ncbi:MAG: MerR family transcriptional regulator [Actinomycetaceae bacterium]|nr:MerR family transcriptional regulator [Actinomycetaceae bacterium]